MAKKTQKCSGNINPRPKKVREWSITAWKEPVFDEKQMKFLVYGEETCPETQKLHYQTYVYFYNAKSFDQVTSYFFKKGENRIAQSQGSFKENLAYCTKDEKYKIFGEEPKQGKRTDLEDVVNDIKEGKLKVDDIAINEPNLYHQYGRTLTKVEDICLRKKWRTEMTEGIWIYGKTAVGKSHAAFKDYNNDTHYVVPKDDKGWWDGYHQQPIVIINDFRGHIKYDTLLEMIDKWPFTVPRRGREPMPFISKKIIITSSLSPEQVYHNREEQDSIEQLLRRLKVVHLKKGMEVDFGSG